MAEPRGGMKPYWKQYGGPGFETLRLAEDTIERYEMVRRGDTILVALSGGPDSTCLLDVCARLGEKLDLSIVIAHIDHGLADDSEEIAARVTTQAAKDGYEVHLARAPDLEGPNLHARARDFRYEFFEIVAAREGATKIATGHTLDDRAETTIARLLHGGGTRSLAGIPAHEGKRIRPLISARRSETRAYCIENSLEYFEDPANRDPRFERAAVRERLVPVIAERWGDGAVRAIARSSERLREDAEALERIGDQLYAEAKASDSGVELSLEMLLRIPRALRRRLLEKAVGPVRDRAGGIDAVLDALDAWDRRVPELPLRYAIPDGSEIVIEKMSVRVVRVEGAPIERTEGPPA